MSSSIANPTREKKLSSGFRELRLAAARAILCNDSNLLCLRHDIHHADHVRELSEEYAFRAVSHWLVTAYGSAVCQRSIPSDLADIADVLADAFSRTGAYPFANVLDDGSFNRFYLNAVEVLNHLAVPEIELLGSLYEHTHKFPSEIKSDGTCDISLNIQQKEKRRLAGQFYTPSSIVDFCFKQALGEEKLKFMSSLKSGVDPLAKPFAEDQSSALRILDPSCGTGNFLLGAVRLFRSQSEDVCALIEFIEQCLYGLEIDGRAAALARVGLIVSAMPSWVEFKHRSREVLTARLRQLQDTLQRHVRTVDTLFAAATNVKDPADWFVANGGFGLVITNPPYVSFGARNQPKLLDSATTFLRHEYPNSAEYKIRIHSIFQEIALRYLEEGGIATLLVPDGFLTGGYYGKLRQLLLDKSQLKSFAELPSDTVPGAVVGRWCVASYQKRGLSQTDYYVDLCSLNEKELRYRINKSALVSRDCHRFRLVFNDIDRDLCCLIDSLDPLSSQLRGHTGIRALSGQASIISESCDGENWRRGLKSGSSVQPHMVTWDGTWLHIDSSLLYRGGFDAGIIGNAKILVRQTGDRLIAAYDDSGLYHLNNLHSLSPRSPLKDMALDLNFVEALLNSSLWLYIYRLKTREQGRALAQIDIETLESMPLPPRNNQLEQLIAFFAQSMRERERKAIHGTSQRIRRAIDSLVYDLYGLDRRFVQQIEQGCGKLTEDAGQLPGIDEIRYLESCARSDSKRIGERICPKQA